MGELERISLMFDIQEIHAAQYACPKRFADVLLGLVGTVFLVLVLPLVAMLDLIGNRGSILSTCRDGWVGGGIEFTIIKFPDDEVHR